MVLNRLEISHFRNLVQIRMDPHARLNLLTGVNGAGKTSVLEAIQCLSTAHSFRTRKPRELIARNQDSYSVSGRFSSADANASEHRIGLSRSRDGSMAMRVNYESIDRVADATRLLPVKALTPDSHALIQEGPELRRQFLDWGVFHVEQRFYDAWRSYRRALSQRNQTLREHRPAIEIRSWSEPLAVHGMAVDTYRQNYVKRLEIALDRRLDQLNDPLDISIAYRGGWQQSIELIDALEQNLEHHLRMRTTTDGPHRAELSIRTGGFPARQTLSRGQQKLLVYLLHLAQLDVQNETGGPRAIVLCDDLLSELDPTAVSNLVDQLEDVSGQLFVSGVSLCELTGRSHRMFHVEQGLVRVLDGNPANAD